MKKVLETWFLAVGCAGAAWALLFYSPLAGEGIRQGLTVCASVMIPSLFPLSLIHI